MKISLKNLLLAIVAISLLLSVGTYSYQRGFQAGRAESAKAEAVKSAEGMRLIKRALFDD